MEPTEIERLCDEAEELLASYKVQLCAGHLPSEKFWELRRAEGVLLAAGFKSDERGIATARAYAAMMRALESEQSFRKEVSLPAISGRLSIGRAVRVGRETDKALAQARALRVKSVKQSPILCSQCNRTEDVHGAAMHDFQ